MPLKLEDYGLIGDTQTAALVGRDGSVDWLCMPRFDSAACFAALLGEPDHGRWLIAPAAGGLATRRRYRPGTLVLETEFEVDEGAIRVIDFMPPREQDPDLVRIVEGVRGRVPVRMELVIRFDYGSIIPWARRLNGTLTYTGGPDALSLRTPVETRGENLTTVAEFTVAEGDRVPFVLTWYPSSEPAPREIEAARALEQTEVWWQDWSARCEYEGEWREPVLSSLIVLKALTYAPTGGIVAAPTTSLPEKIGGVRNWDYRYCWLRDATFTLYSLLLAGYTTEAREWRDWLLRAVAGDPADLQIMYGPAGERRLTEIELDWLPGYEGSRPVRIGNAASDQLQLDVYGEVMDVLHQARSVDLQPSLEEAAWALQRKLLDYLEGSWREPDEGIWEVRGPRRHFTHSKVMAWVAADRAVRAVEDLGLEGPVDDWKRLRSEIHDEVCREGYDADRRTFIQSYGSKQLDASLLMIPLIGFLPPSDDRVRGTVEAIERELCEDGFVARYSMDEASAEVDGLPPGEGAFLPCTFWLADNLHLLGRKDEARRVFERLLALRNDLGLLAEEYDTESGRLVGNFPQAFSHVGLVNTAHNLSSEPGPAQERPQATSSPQR
ncbi:MAG: glycoside hydrolase family 15 protein, partial [Actinomycetota bacterium]|nr:glycoside hydrolase family 15 protein [Actinomycetota bacterium]